MSYVIQHVIYTRYDTSLSRTSTRTGNYIELIFTCRTSRLFRCLNISWLTKRSCNVTLEGPSRASCAAERTSVFLRGPAYVFRNRLWAKRSTQRLLSCHCNRGRWSAGHACFCIRREQRDGILQWAGRADYTQVSQRYNEKDLVNVRTSRREF